MDQLLFIETINMLEFLKSSVCLENRVVIITVCFVGVFFLINATLIFFCIQRTFALHLEFLTGS